MSKKKAKLKRNNSFRPVHKTPASWSLLPLPQPHIPHYLCPQAVLLSVHKHSQVIEESKDGPAVAELGGQCQQARPHF